MRNYYVDIPKVSGIYMWYNKINGKKYIGSAINLFNRVGTHLRRMRNGNNDCGFLQAAYNKYGEANLLFVILMTCEQKDLLKFEQYFIDEMNPEYNKRPVAYSNLGLKFSEETKEKQRAAHVDRKYPEFEDSWKNPYWKGKHHSQDTIKKLRVASTGRKHTKEEIEKQSKNQLGVTRYFKTLKGTLTSPDGIKYTNIENLEKFGREHNIDKRRMSEFYSGKRISWRGWKYVVTIGI